MKEALKLAQKALSNKNASDEAIYKALHAIKAALAQPDPYKQGYADAMNWKLQNHLEHLPQRQPLTRGQIREIEVDVSLNPSFDYITPAEQLCRAIEAAHGIGEKNDE